LAIERGRVGRVLAGRGKAPLSRSFQPDSGGSGPFDLEPFSVYGNVVVIPAEGDQVVGVGGPTF
jgi:hypothetical protein